MARISTGTMLGADGLDGQDATVGARDVGDAEGAGVGREEIGDAGEDLFWSGGEVEDFYGELVAFGAGEPGRILPMCS